MWEPQPLATLRASTACTGITLQGRYTSFALNLKKNENGKRIYQIIIQTKIKLFLNRVPFILI
jgi:hypothetical protein